MILADLSLQTIEKALRWDGLCVRAGPIVVKLRSPLQAVGRGLALHYAKHPVEPNEGFADFHVCVARDVRQWFSQLAVFRLDTEPIASMRGSDGFALFERGLTWCVFTHCHQYLLVRAAVLERGGRALVLPAPPNAGKSTLAAGLTFAGGWRLLSDDLALIEPVSGNVVPLPRPLRLKGSSIDLVREFAPTAVIGEVTHDSSAMGRVANVRPPADGVSRANESAPPAWVIVPRYVPDAGAQLKPRSRARAFMSLVDNALNYKVHGRGGFTAFANLVDRCECHSFSFSSLPEAIAVFDQLARSAR